MDFEQFKNSKFATLAQLRFDYVNGVVNQRDFYIIDTREIEAITDTYLNTRIPTLANQITLGHLRRILEIKDDIMPTEFRDMICQQWIETSSIIKRITKKFADNAYLIITRPGMSLPEHDHYHKQILTFCYSFDEQKLTEGTSHLTVNGKQINFPEDKKVCFSMRDQAKHGVYSTEWRFFWINDFDEYLEFPADIDFTCMKV